jgi:tetratricopeptide (TPR) repeat protein
VESSESPAESTSEHSLPSAETPSAAPADDLPEWEPLTPELLEDEAIRGDFVLRWAVAGLALLLGCAQFTQARPLVLVRTGEWLAANGFLPSGKDPFSIAGADLRWVHLHWLLDLLVAGVHALGGVVGLSIVQGLVACGVWIILGHAYRPGIRTWWGSVCATLALLAAMPRLNLTPELVTLAGLAATMWLLVWCEEQGTRSGWWGFVPLLWLWAQMDPRAWMGASLLLLYGLGQLLQRRTVEPDEAARPKLPIVPVAAALAAMLVHPFVWETWWAPIGLYGTEYPTLRAAYPRPIAADLAWYPLWSPLLWNRLNVSLMSGLLLAVAGAAALWLDRARFSLPHLLVYTGANLVGLLAWHDLPAAGIVNCVLATIHGQNWYYQRFGQVYSTNLAEVVFSRGGRALTVLGLFALAWLTVSGRIDGPDGRRSGVGLDRQLQAEIEAFRRLEGLTANDRVFHLTLRQGDALIAAGRKSFVDHRVQLFARPGAENLILLHERVRRTLRRPRANEPAGAADATWKDVFQKYQLSHALPRLTQGVTGPDYETLFDMLSRNDWSLTEVLPTTMVLHWTRSPDPQVQEFAAAHAINVVDQAFRHPAVTNDQPREHPVPRTWSEQLFSVPRRQLSGPTLLAHHWLRLVANTAAAPLPFRLSCATLAVRAAQAGVTETPELPAAYAALAEAYTLLGQLEGLALAESGLPWNASLRYRQAVAAAQTAARLEPDNLAIHTLLAELYHAAGRIDAAHEAAKKVVQLTPVPDPDDAFGLQRRESLLKVEADLAREVERVAKVVEEQLQKGTDRLEVATALYQSGNVRRAAAILQEDAVYVEKSPAARQLLTAALAELGAGPALDESAARLSDIAELAGLIHWRDVVAVAALARTDYATAISQWERELARADQDQLQALLYTAPMVTASPIWLGETGFPVTHAAMVQTAFQLRPHELALAEFHRAACELERANSEGAILAIRRALQRAPASPLRPLLRLYLFCLTEETIDLEPPADWIPLPADVFATDG